MKTTFVFENITFDLTIPYADVTGAEWMWTGDWSNGEPLMQQRSDRDDCQPPLPFVDLYWDHGPLIPINPRPTFADGLAAIAGDPVAASLPRLTGHPFVPAPLEKATFRSFLASLHRGAS